jgi:predicted nucleic-acid-binding protein
MRAVDTNGLVRILTRDDTKQAAAADGFVSNGAWVSLLVLAETTWVLNTVYELKAERVARTIEMLLDHKDLTLQDADVVSLALAQFRAHPSVGFSDCLILEVARKAGHVPLGTFDRSLSKLDGAHRIS